MHRPLRIRNVARRRFAIDGTPTDCVLLALQIVIKDGPVDLVLSGVNHGGNLGEDVTYSGTIAAAMEATLFNVPAFALSQCCQQRPSGQVGDRRAACAGHHRPPVHKGLAEGSADQRQLSRLPAAGGRRLSGHDARQAQARRRAAGEDRPARPTLCLDWRFALRRGAAGGHRPACGGRAEDLDHPGPHGHDPSSKLRPPPSRAEVDSSAHERAMLRQ